MFNIILFGHLLSNCGIPRVSLSDLFGFLLVFLFLQYLLCLFVIFNVLSSIHNLHCIIFFKFLSQSPLDLFPPQFVIKLKFLSINFI